MKILLPFTFVAAFVAMADLPPSEVSVQEAFTAEQEAERSIAHVVAIYKELIMLQDSVVDEESASAASARIDVLNQELNAIIEHQKANPDLREAMIRYLSQHPERIEELQAEQIRYQLSTKRCLESGLLKNPAKAHLP